VLHLGSAAVPVRVRPLGADLARLSLARPLPLRVGDRGLLRDPGRHRIAAGLLVLDVAPPTLSRRGAAARRAADLAAAIEAGPRSDRGTVSTPGNESGPGTESGPADVPADQGGPPGPGGAEVADPVAAELAALHVRNRGLASAAGLTAMGLPAAGIRVAGDWLADEAGWAELLARVRPAYRGWRDEHPLAAGMPAEELRRTLGLPAPELLAVLVRAAGLMTENGLVRGPEAPGLPAALERAVRALERELAASPFAAPEARRLAELRLGARELAAAVRAGRLLRLAEGVVLLPGAPAAAARVLASLPAPFTLSQARQALRTSRRVAVPLLELLDRSRLTERLPDDTRRLR
jgi:selenocysteine-specific elongation factor